MDADVTVAIKMDNITFMKDHFQNPLSVHAKRLFSFRFMIVIKLVYLLRLNNIHKAKENYKFR